MQLVSLTGASSVTDPDHGTVEADKHGVFEVAEELGHKLLAFKTDWRTKVGHDEHLAALEAERLADPKEGVKLLTELRDRIAALEAEVKSLKAKRTAK